MTQTAQNVAEVYGLTREEMDQFSVESHRKCAAAYATGIYKDEIIPLEVEEPVFDDQGNWARPTSTARRWSSSSDECLRPGTNMEALGAQAGQGHR